MFDRMEAACRRYQHLAPNPGAAMTHSQADQLCDWLQRDAGQVVENLLERPEFRRRARWPIEHLIDDVTCSERRLVLDVDRTLIEIARQLSSIARQEPIWNHLLHLGPYQEEVADYVTQMLDMCAGETVTSLPLDLAEVEFIASRPWRDLASANDYFHPTSQMNLRDEKWEQWSVFTPFFNRKLAVPGDFISRCLEIRIDHWRQALDRFAIRCDTARRRAGAIRGPSWQLLDERRLELQTACDKLRVLCFEGNEVRLRDSCIALLQVHAGFHPNTDLSWLGPVARLAGTAAIFQHHVGQQLRWDVPERIAAALTDVAGTFRRPRDPEDVIEEKKRTTRLVLVEEPRQGFLDGEPIEEEEPTVWYDRQALWEFIWELAEKAQRKRKVDRMTFSGRQDVSAGALKNRRSDLKNQIVPSLDELIVTSGTGSYSLILAPKDICLLVSNAEETLVEQS